MFLNSFLHSSYFALTKRVWRHHRRRRRQCHCRCRRRRRRLHRHCRCRRRRRRRHRHCRCRRRRRRRHRQLGSTHERSPKSWISPDGDEAKAEGRDRMQRPDFD